MRHTFPEELLSKFGRFVETRIGLHIPQSRLVDLERGVRAAAKEVGWTDAEAFARHLLRSPVNQELEDLLAAHLTIGETYFYRDPRAFEVFEKEVLPEVVRNRLGKEKKLRIWSAACCTGEEPYSLAMAVRRTLGEESGWKVSLLATDLNPRFLRKAAVGLYGPWSFRTLPEEMRGRFFHKQANERWQLDERIKRDVTFANLNFMEDSFPSAANNTQALDVIFCRNVLMYFSRETAAKVIAKLRKCLVDGGWLFTSATDAPRDLFAGFAVHEAEGTVVYRRCSDDPSAAKPTPVFFNLPSLSSPTADPFSSKFAIEPARVPHEHTTKAEPSSPPPVVEKVPVPALDADLRHRARSLADQGRFDEALAAIDLAILSDKLDALAHYLRGVILHEQSAEAEAVTSLNRALFLDPSFVLAHVTLGNLMRRVGKERAARRHFDNAREILSRLERDAVLPESGGMSAGRLLHILSTPQAAAA
jgi:chemotaxis protein methyltransferase CheR